MFRSPVDRLVCWKISWTSSMLYRVRALTEWKILRCLTLAFNKSDVTLLGNFTQFSWIERAYSADFKCSRITLDCLCHDRCSCWSDDESFLFELLKRMDYFMFSHPERRIREMNTLHSKCTLTKVENLFERTIAELEFDWRRHLCALIMVSKNICQPQNCSKSPT